MKKNDDNKYIRIGIFAVVFLLGLFVSIKEKNGWIALIACVGVPLLYIPYGISDWKRRKQDNPPEKHNKPAKTVAPNFTFDLFFEQIYETGAIFESGVIFAQWTVTKSSDNSDSKTKPERSDIYILTDSAYHNVLGMLGAWKPI